MPSARKPRDESRSESSRIAEATGVPTGSTAAGPRVRCPDCDLAQRLPARRPDHRLVCARCGRLLRARAAPPLEVPLCLALAGLWMWLIANVTPFLSLRYRGASTTTYLAGGVEALWVQGFYLLSSLVLFTGVLAPLLELACISALLILFRRGLRTRGLKRGLRFLTALGPWTMPGIFLVGVLVAGVKMAQMASMLPGSGFAALVALVVLWTSVHATLDLDALWEIAGVEK